MIVLAKEILKETILGMVIGQRNVDGGFAIDLFIMIRSKI
jgi:hypothetical protein